MSSTSTSPALASQRPGLDLVKLENYLASVNPPRWGKTVTDSDNHLTNFIYNERRYHYVEHLTLNQLARREPNFTPARASQLVQYAQSRWFQNWTAQGQELLFHQAGAEANPNIYDKNWDFAIQLDGQRIELDHKASVWPAAATWRGTADEVRQDPRELIEWLLTYASRSGRWNTNNKVYVVTKSSSGDHARLKGAFSLIQPRVEAWMARPQLYDFQQDGQAFRCGLILVEA